MGGGGVGEAMLFRTLDDDATSSFFNIKENGMEWNGGVMVVRTASYICETELLEQDCWKGTKGQGGKKRSRRNKMMMILFSSAGPHLFHYNHLPFIFSLLPPPFD